MASKHSIEVYLELLAETDQALTEKRLLVENSTDGRVKHSLLRTIHHLEEMRAIYQKLVDNLLEIYRLDDDKNPRNLPNPKAGA